MARSYFETNRYHDAARYYRAAFPEAASHPFKGVFKDERDIEREIRLSAAWALKLGGDPAQAEAVIRSGISKARDPGPDLLLLARLRADAGDFRAAYETLRELEDFSPGESGGDWRVSTILALGGVAWRGPSEADALLAKSPEIGGIIESFLADYWPRYNRLSPKAKQQWLRGVYYSHWPLGASLRAGVLDDATLKFATAVECELRARVFEPFRESTRQSRKGQPPPRKASSDDGEARPLLDFLQGRGRGFTLGPMLRCLSAGASPKQQELAEFQSWRRREQRELVGRVLTDLEDVVKARNEVTHAGGVSDPRRVAEACRRIIDAIAVPRDGE